MRWASNLHIGFYFFIKVHECTLINLHTGLCFISEVLEWVSAGVEVHQLLAIDNGGTTGIMGVEYPRDVNVLDLGVVWEHAGTGFLCDLFRLEHM